MDESLDNIEDVLSQVVRLTSSRAQGPAVVVTPPSVSKIGAAGESAAPWSWTAAEATSTELALLPLLTHLAVAKDDVDALIFCLKPESESSQFISASPATSRTGGVTANCTDAASGRSPLHVAALNGSKRCVRLLLENGALVHLRDGLGHTALYYVRPCSRIFECGFSLSYLNRLQDKVMRMSLIFW